MHDKKLYALLLFSSICFVSCKKKDHSPSIDFGPNGGISMRDVRNYPQGTPDPTDWTLDSKWNQQEQNLFSSLGLDLNATATGTVSNMSAYPNPVGGGQTVFHYDTPVAVTCSYAVVDAKYQPVLPMETVSTSGRSFQLMMDVSGNAYQQGKLYRIYYVLHNGSSLYYKGHGDIKIGQ